MWFHLNHCCRAQEPRDVFSESTGEGLDVLQEETRPVLVILPQMEQEVHKEVHSLTDQQLRWGRDLSIDSQKEGSSRPLGPETNQRKLRGRHILVIRAIILVILVGSGIETLNRKLIEET